MDSISWGRYFIVIAALLFLSVASGNTFGQQGQQGQEGQYPEQQSDLLTEEERYLLGPDSAILVDVSDQRLYLLENRKPIANYVVSTSRHGPGNRAGSFQTPLGLHEIGDRIGTGYPLGAIFKGRKPTGESAKIETSAVSTTQDLVTSRILRLTGLEDGVNQGPGIDSWQRLIYIHGTHEEGLLGQPASNGCIRLANSDVIELFQRVKLETRVLIRE